MMLETSVTAKLAAIIAAGIITLTGFNPIPGGMPGIIIPVPPATYGNTPAPEIRDTNYVDRGKFFEIIEPVGKQGKTMHIHVDKDIYNDTLYDWNDMLEIVAITNQDGKVTNIFERERHNWKSFYNKLTKEQQTILDGWTIRVNSTKAYKEFLEDLAKKSKKPN